MDSKNKVILISVIAGILVIGLVVGANVSGKAVVTLKEIPTDFAIDAWGYAGWGDCSDQYGTKAQLDAFCASKGHVKLASVNACKHSSIRVRWQWDGKLPMEKGRSTGRGIALTAVKCTTSSGSPAGSQAFGRSPVTEGRVADMIENSYRWCNTELVVGSNWGTDKDKYDTDGDGWVTGDEFCESFEPNAPEGFYCTETFVKYSPGTYGAESYGDYPPNKGTTGCSKHYCAGDESKCESSRGGVVQYSLVDDMWATCCRRAA